MKRMYFTMGMKMFSLMLAVTMLVSLAACGNKDNSGGETTNAATEAESGAEATEAGTTTAAVPESTETAEKETAESASESQGGSAEGKTAIRVGSLNGPTSMGLVSLMDKAEKGEAANDYTFTRAAAADEINTAFIKGDLDIVLVPANVASVLYNKTQGQVAVIDINTLGVLYLLESGEAINSVEDLEGKTIYLPGKGTTPDYALQYVLAGHGLTADKVDLQYKSEAAEVIAALAEDSQAVGLLPQPAVTTAAMQNENLRIALDLTKEWDGVSEDGSLVTGVTLVRRAFLEENEDAVNSFLEEHAASSQFTNDNADEAAAMIEALGIVPKAAIAKQAIPYCNITCITGEDMKTALSGYLSVLEGQNPESVGGALPKDDFYFMEKQ